ncbi:hypothetical protein BGZ70_004967 [Mortierella alpina]|uniref:Uncharacterized protein n=1 Tax=Mortierella alpina TaxID=64518 RepID=A0A9P6M4N5_MORAP|nr:hypothetical protein BGZ70_004967 [Mortierella alpina]
MTLEQLDQVHQRKQQSLLEEQIQLEQSQRMRQQRELQLELAKHRNAILEQQHKQQLLRRREHERQLQEQQQENKQRPVEQVPCNDTAAAAVAAVADDSVRHPAKTPLHPYVATQHRSMFGYRGPEQRMALSTSSEAITTMEEEEVDESMQSGATSVRIPFLMAAESRVRLAMMDYTPKQIDAMTLEEAQAILSCPSFSSTTESYMSQEEQCDVSKGVEELTEALAEAGVLSSSSASPIVDDLSRETDQEDHRYTLQASLPVHGQAHDAEGHVPETSRRAPGNPSSSSSSSSSTL